MSRLAVNLTGQRFGKLLVVKRGLNDRSDLTQWECQCDCGTFKVIRSSSLRSGDTRSCGCHNRESKTTHGDSRSSENMAWVNMILRCTDPKNGSWKNYGGRGIKVCDEWIDNYSAFINHIGRKPSPEHSLDRIDNDGNYEPGNVRWATATEQIHNRRSNGV